jgi:hypothetical protein
MGAAINGVAAHNERRTVDIAAVEMDFMVASR